MGGGPVLRPMVAPAGRAPRHPARVKHGRGAGGAPRGEVVAVRLGAALRRRVDRPQARVTHGGPVTQATYVGVILVAVDPGPPGGAVTLGTSDGAAVRKPETSLAVVTCRFNV